MQPRHIFITAFDKQRLEELIAVAAATGQPGREDLGSLSAELARSQVVEPQQVPPDVVTMNSKVLLRDLDNRETMTYRLVFPLDANLEAGDISVLAPVGTAILGYRAGDTIEWEVPSGKRRLKIEKVVFQPEAAGHYNL